jgi:phosphohistidine phosphatase
MTIYLVQHGKSVSKEENPERPLSEIGAEEAEKIASKLKDYNIRLTSIFHTNKLRAVQTAEILQSYFNASQGTKEIAGMNPNDDVRLFAANIDKVDNAMYVGHLPFMEKLASFLTTGDDSQGIFKFQNAGVVKLQYFSDEESWFITGSFLPKPI